MVNVTTELDYPLIWLVTSHTGKPPIIENVNQKALYEAKKDIQAIIDTKVNLELSRELRWIAATYLQTNHGDILSYVRRRLIEVGNSTTEEKH